MSAAKIDKSSRNKESNMKVDGEAAATAGKPCIDFQPGDRWQIKDGENTNNVESVVVNSSPPKSRKRKSRSRRRNNSSRASKPPPPEVNGEVNKSVSDEGEEDVQSEAKASVENGDDKEQEVHDVSEKASVEPESDVPDCTNGEDSAKSRKRRCPPSPSDVDTSTKKKYELPPSEEQKDPNDSKKESSGDKNEEMIVCQSDSTSGDIAIEKTKAESKSSRECQSVVEDPNSEVSVVTSSEKVEPSSKKGGPENLIVVSDEESDNDVQVISSTSDEKTEEKDVKTKSSTGKSVADFNVSHDEETLMSAGFPYLNSLQEKIKDLQPGKYKPVKFPHMGTLMLEENEVIIESPSLLVPLLIKERDQFPPLDSGDQEKPVATTSEDEKGKPNSSVRRNFFQSSVGQFLINLGASRVLEWYHRDMRRFKMKQTRRQGYNKDLEEEIIQHGHKYQSLKETNGPFSFRLIKCQLCDFKTESALLMDSHYMVPHMSSRREFKCNFCRYMTRDCKEIIVHFKDVHDKRAVLEDQMSLHECLFCSFQSHQRAKVNVHMNRCRRNFIPTQNLSPPFDFEFPGVTTKPVTIADVIAHRKMLLGSTKSTPYQNIGQTVSMESLASAWARKKLASVINMGPEGYPDSPTLVKHLMGQQVKQGVPGLQLPPGLMLTRPRVRATQLRQGNQNLQPRIQGLNQAGYVQSISSAASQLASSGISITPVGKQDQSAKTIPVGAGLKNITLTPISSAGNQVVSQKPGPPQPVALFTNVAGNDPSRNRPGLSQPGRVQQPNLSGKPQRLMGPYQRLNTPPSQVVKSSSGSSFVMCEICDSYIKDLDELRSHMNWVHKVKIHPKMLVSRPPLNCQKCQWRFFTDQGLERHLLGAHGLVTTNMQEMANKNQDGGRCIICGAVFTYKLVSHMTQVHKVTLKPAHLSYKCTVCTATFTLYRLFESHVYNVHSSAAKRSAEESSSSEPQPKKPAIAKASPAANQPPAADSAGSSAQKKKKEQQPQPQQQQKETTAKPQTQEPQAKRCRECQMVTVDMLAHIKEKHIKECRVKLCRVEKCEKCLCSSDGMIVIRLDQLGLDEDESSSEESGDDGDSSDSESKKSDSPSSKSKNA